MTSTIRRLLPDALVVASAGNDLRLAGPSSPPALSEVVAAGRSTAPAELRSRIHEPWVDACAPAVDVVSTFFTDFPGFEGWAAWSGTSFRRTEGGRHGRPEMYLTKISAKDAWARLRNYQRFHYPDLGQVFNF